MPWADCLQDRRAATRNSQCSPTFNRRMPWRILDAPKHEVCASHPAVRICFS